MEDAICLDTDILADLIRGKKDANQWFRDHEDKFQLATTIINLFELYYGAYRSADPERSLGTVKEIIESLDILTIDSECAKEAAKQLARLSSEGNIIDFKDLFIGCISLSSSHALKTNNKKHFERIDGLKLV
ncbi:MAG: type II toxin-antitoxin system VapC family toxin [Nanoarchaeota archaeon]